MTLTLPLPTPFGASELKARSRSFLFTAWLIAASAHLVAITAIRVVQTVLPGDALNDGHVVVEQIGPPPPPPDIPAISAAASRAVSDAPPTENAFEPVLNAVTDATTSVGDGLVGDLGAAGVQGSGGDAIVVPQAPQAEDPLVVFDPTGVEELPIAVVAPRPEYPEWAIDAGIEGTVHVEAIVDKDGLIREAHVTRSIKALDDAALTAVLRSVWRPAMNHGRPVRVHIDVPIRFSLRDRF